MRCSWVRWRRSRAIPPRREAGHDSRRRGRGASGPVRCLGGVSCGCRRCCPRRGTAARRDDRHRATRRVRCGRRTRRLPRRRARSSRAGPRGRHRGAPGGSGRAWIGAVDGTAARGTGGGSGGGATRHPGGLGVSTARALDTVLYAPSITVSLAYREDQVPQAVEGAGFVVALDSGAALRACTYAWRKYLKRAPEGYALLRAFVGPVDGDPSSIAHAELAAILGIEGDPLWTRAFYWPRGLPRYPRGHGERVAAVRDRLARLPPLAIAGAGFDGAGVSACVKAGREAAKQILERLGSAGPVRGGSRGS